MKRSLSAARIAVAAAALALGASALRSSAQEPVPPTLPTLPTGAPQGDNSREEMIELFRKVEKRLGEIDKLLYDASAGETSLAGKSLESGLSDLLKDSKSKSEDVLSGIDRILEIAKQQGGT
jgi:hypothetical protein